ncbi:MAG: asparagine synthetase B [Gemmatimonadetes bacterium]|nr:MAG: asparagine synthetase B [Gemmatimonadota bacterium]
MDLAQTDHLKAYGLAYWCLQEGYNVEWLLNYRNGSFLVDEFPGFREKAIEMGVSYSTVSGSEVAQIYSKIESENMERVLLEKPPEVAIYTPPNKQPWDDAVTLALTYADIPYETVYDEEVLEGKLEDFDWLHLHHEDFTGQYGKFYASFRNAEWYQLEVLQSEQLAHKLGFSKVSQLKSAVAETIKAYVANGGFLFAMCSATDTFEIALAAYGVDICAPEFDGDPIDPNFQSKLDYTRCFAFENFHLESNPLVYEFSDIDASNYAEARGAEADYFTLFEFSAKYDPVPTMLTQCHVNVVNGFLGQTTSFHKEFIKKSVTIMGEVEGANEVKYLHGKFGQGTFTYYGGHDPEDYRHRVGDPPTRLSLHKNSPGYRLILNNILFPAAKKKERKT